jgi:hypothetical protein
MNGYKKCRTAVQCEVSSSQQRNSSGANSVLEKEKRERKMKSPSKNTLMIYQQGTGKIQDEL